MCKACAPHISCASSFDDVLFRVEAREKRRAHQGQRTDQKGDPRDGHVLTQATHVADVLIMMHADDD